MIIRTDAAIYLITFLYWLIKLKKLNVGLIILGIMTISHLGTIFYYTILSSLGVYMNIQIAPYVFLYLMIVMGLYPFLTYKGLKHVNIGGNLNTIKGIAIFIIFVNLEPLLENIYLALFSRGEYADLYEDKQDGALEIYSFIGEKFMRWASYFKICATVSLFYFLSKYKSNRYLLLGLFLCQINYVLQGMNTGSRGNIVSQVIMCVLCFVLFSPQYSSHLIRKTKKNLLILLIPIGLLLFGITASRYESGRKDKSMVEWIFLYVSEGPIKFNNEMWDGEHNTNGDVNMNFLKDLLGMKTYVTYEERNDHYIAKNGRWIEVFYTYVGDFVSDFGIIGAFFICVALFLITKKILKSDTLHFHDVLLLMFLLHFYAIGFASNCYRSYFLQRGLFYNSFIYIYLFFASKRFSQATNRSITSKQI